MLPILVYLLKANLVLLLFAAAYFGLLRRLTFFTLNRAYLVFALLFSAVFPALPMPALLPAEAASTVVLVVTATTGAASGSPAVPAAPPVDWAAVGVGLYAAGAAVLLARLLIQLLALGRLRWQTQPAVAYGVSVRVPAGTVSPFSFWQTIYLNPEQHPGPELAAVLRHEQVHVHQWHTLDVLLAQLVQAAAWCNPAAWLLRRAVLDNLEYLADHAVLETGLDRRAYQYSLLRLSHAAAAPSLVSSFTFPTLKNRVAMMNTPLSSTGQLARYLVAGPLVLVVALGFSAARAQGAGPVVPAAATAAPARPVALQPVPAPAAAALPAAAQPAAPARKAQPAKPLSNTAKTASAAAPAATLAASIRPASKHSGPPPVYYLDGKVTNDAIGSINPNDIAHIEVFKDERARRLAGDAGAGGVVIITTKQNQDTPEVQAFNQKLGIGPALAVAPEPAGGTPYLAAPALAYITSHYPAARLLGVTEVSAADGTKRYQAQIVLGRRPAYLLFDGQGQFISEAYTSYVK